MKAVCTGLDAISGWIGARAAATGVRVADFVKGPHMAAGKTFRDLTFCQQTCVVFRGAAVTAGCVGAANTVGVAAKHWQTSARANALGDALFPHPAIANDAAAKAVKDRLESTLNRAEGSGEVVPWKILSDCRRDAYGLLEYVDRNFPPGAKPEDPPPVHLSKKLYHEVRLYTPLSPPCAARAKPSLSWVVCPVAPIPFDTQMHLHDSQFQVCRRRRTVGETVVQHVAAVPLHSAAASPR